MENKRIFDYKKIDDVELIKFNKFDSDMFFVISHCNFIEQTKEFVLTATFELKPDFKRDTYNFRSFQKCNDCNFPYMPGIKDFLKNNEHTVFTIDKRIGSENICDSTLLVACEKCDEFIETLNYNFTHIVNDFNNAKLKELRKEFII